jgi:hypothetical protein
MIMNADTLLPVLILVTSIVLFQSPDNTDPNIWNDPVDFYV